MMLRKWLGPAHRVDWKAFFARATISRPILRRVVFAVSFLFIVLLVHREVYSFILQRRQFSVPSIQMALVPKWADSRSGEIVRVAGGGATLFDRDLVGRVGRAVEACPWVRKVTAVERVFPDQVRVRFEYRRPHVAVRRSNGFVLVDAAGIRLPGVYVEPPPCDRAVELIGIASLPPPPGRVWEDPAVKAGIRMADFVEATAMLKNLSIREIDLSNYGGRQDPRRSEVALTTRTGCTLFWGRTSSTERFGDVSPEAKLENLREVLAAYPYLDGVRYATLYFKGTRSVGLTDPHVKGPGPRAR